MRRKYLFVVALGLAALRPGVAAASEVPQTPATYHGRTIDLANGWEGATACVVLSSSDIRCFDSEEEMLNEVAEGEEGMRSQVKGEVANESLSATSVGCSGLVSLYDDEAFTGASLSFAATYGWQNLTEYGFNDRMESWRNNRNCAAIVAWDINGGGSQLVLAASSSDNAVSASWKNQASSIMD